MVREIMEIRELVKEEYDTALDLVWEVFQEFEAPDYAPHGVEAFNASIHDPDYLTRQLFPRACQENPTKQMTVNSSPYTLEECTL